MTKQEFCNLTSEILGVKTTKLGVGSSVDIGWLKLVFDKLNSNVGHKVKATKHNLFEGILTLLGADLSTEFLEGGTSEGSTVTAEGIEKIATLGSDLQNQNWKDAAIAITTTDTFPKGAHRAIKIGKTTINLVGIAKGSGMIAPDMATMLGFIFTDAQIPAQILQKLLTRNVKSTFNSITVDGDTSPNDSSVLVASGRTKSPIKRGTAIERKIRSAVIEIYKELADLLIKDAEGATKKITIKVVQAKTEKQAESVAFTVAESPLVKTAMFGNDANWGRILSAIGRSPEVNDVSKTSIHLNGVPLAKNGNLHPQHSESKASKEITKKNLEVTIKLGLGKSTFSVITSDFSEDYLLINSDYRS